LFILTLPNIGVIPHSLELFRVRSLIIGGSIIPIIGALLQIWAPRMQKYHNKIMLAIAIYWTLMALLGATESFIMITTIPMILIFGIVMIVTFTITWKTGRLKEVRSDLMVLSLFCGMGSQVLRVPLLTTGLFFVPDIMLMMSMIVTALAIGNPWFKKEFNARETTSSHHEIEIAVG
jgi:MFS family permease